jgi:ABC-type branched-subunit amino acid transport system ATPase component/ABC-type branched-subunit amino acid transport system permease subunit
VTDFWKFFLLGLGSGAIYALVALGIVIVYRGSGVVNFATGALTLTGAAVFNEVRANHATSVAIVAGVLAAGLAGAAVNLLVMTPMRRSSPLARVIATLAVLGLGNELWKHRLGEQGFTIVSSFLPHDPVEPFGGGIIIGEDRIWILGITLGLAAALWVLYRRTRFGLATTAVAENEAVAAAQGWSPTTIATTNWLLGGALAGFAGIMLSTVAGLSTTSQTLVMIPAMAAALVGGFSSFPLTVAGGLLVGVLESEALFYAEPTGVTKGLQTAVPFLVIIAILVVRGKPLPLRSFLADRLPSIGSGRTRPVVVLATGAIAIATLLLFGDDWANAVITSAIFGLVALSLVVLTGYAGQLSLAQWSLAGMGALFAGRLAGDVWGLPFPIALALGTLLAVPVGVIVSLPALRVRGVSLAVTTLALSLVITTMILTNEEYTGGLLRGTVIPTPSIFGWDVGSVAHPERYGAVAVALVVLAALVVTNLRRGRVGRRLIAVRDNERAAASMGISVFGAKVYAFAVSSALAAVGGALVAFRNTNLGFDQFDLFGNINAVVLGTVGGIGWIAGAVVAGVGRVAGVVDFVVRQLVSIDTWYEVAAGAVLLIVIVALPDGVVPGSLAVVRRLRMTLRRPQHETTTAAPMPLVRGDVAPRKVAPKRLEIVDVTVSFGAVVALENVTLHVEPGEVVGLIGPNGAGKTTLIEAATGFVSSRGSVRVAGQDVGRLSPRGRAAAGLTRSFQSLELFEDLSVLDNLRVAADDGRRLSYATDLVWPTEQSVSSPALAAIEEFQLDRVLNKKPEELPYAQRRTVAIARAVSSSPSILLLDEPAAGLDDWSTNELSLLIRRLADEWGMAVLLVEHDVGMVMGTCDRVVVLDFGHVIAQGAPEEIRSHPAVVSAYLGPDASKDAPALADQLAPT